MFAINGMPEFPARSNYEGDNMITALLYLASVVCLAIALLTATGHGASNALAWFIAGVFFYVVSTAVASWDSVRHTPRA